MNLLDKGKRFYYLIFCFVLQNVSCTNAAKELNENERQQIKNEISGLLHANFKNIAEKGYMEDLKSLDNSPGFYWIPPGQTMPISYDSVAAIIKKFIPGNRSVVSTWDTLHVQPINKEIATYAGKYHSIYTDTTGKVLEFNMHEIGTVVKRKEGWKIVSGKTSVLE